MWPHKVIIVLFSLIAAGCSRRAQIQRDADATAETLRRNVRYLSITPGAPILEGESPVSSFVLTLGESSATQTYPFELKRYTLQTGSDPDRTPTQNLCAVIERLRVADTAAPVNGGKNPEIGAGVNIGPFELSISQEIAIAELLFGTGKLSNIPHSHAFIAIRGYADGQHGPWTDTLIAKYRYDTIHVLPPTGDADNPSGYLLRDSVIHIQDGTYNNSLLPDLRAEFVRQVLVLPFLQNCQEYHPEVKILKGFEFSEADRPENRKVQVFVYIFEDDFWESLGATKAFK